LPVHNALLLSLDACSPSVFCFRSSLSLSTVFFKLYIICILFFCCMCARENILTNIQWAKEHRGHLWEFPTKRFGPPLHPLLPPSTSGGSNASASSSRHAWQSQWHLPPPSGGPRKFALDSNRFVVHSLFLNNIPSTYTKKAFVRLYAYLGMGGKILGLPSCMRVCSCNGFMLCTGCWRLH